jgi:hypothetical protein
MVVYSALFVVQAMESTHSEYLSDWNIFRLSILLELVTDLQKQARDRHACDLSNMSSPDAMSRQLSRAIRLLLRHKSTGSPPKQTNEPLPFASTAFPQVTPTSDVPVFEDFAGFTFGNTALSFETDFSIDNFLSSSSFHMDFGNPAFAANDFGLPVFSYGDGTVL